MQLTPAPIGEDETILRAVTPTKTGPAGSDRTECNYLVMFFVLGVFLLAFMDSI
jgi:hypothetical protein